MATDRVALDFSQDEALVLFEWLSAFVDADNAAIPERWVLWKLEGLLERQVNVVVSPRFEQELQEARARIVASNGSDKAEDG